MKAELKRGFTSPLFFLSMAVLFLCLQGYSLPSYCNQWFGEGIEPLELRQSALSMTLGGIFFGGMLLLLPFCASMAYATIQVDDLRSSLMKWSVLRSSIRCYAARKITVAFLCGAIAAGLAFSIHASLWHLLTLPYDPLMYPNHEIGFWQDSFFLEWSTISNGLPMIIEIAFGLALTAGIWSVVALAVSIWVPDKLLVVIIPASIFKLWSANLSYYLFGFRLPSPDTLFNDAQTVQGDLQCLVAYSVLLLLAITVYFIGLKRRACHA
ncbi:MAG: hypothetical protein RSC68_18390 [Acinetobacter sp.]